MICIGHRRFEIIRQDFMPSASQSRLAEIGHSDNLDGLAIVSENR
jgi:hypothetical protein